MHMPDFIYGPFPMKIQISTCVVHVLYSPLYNLNEWDCPWRFLWSQSLFVTGAWVVLFALLILPLYFNLRKLHAYDGENLTYACECKLIKLSLVICLCFLFRFTCRLALEEYRWPPIDWYQVTPYCIKMVGKPMLNFHRHTYKTPIWKTTVMKDTASLNLGCTRFNLSDTL